MRLKIFQAWRRVTSVGVGFILVVLLCGFTPEECTLKHATSDLEKAEVIAIGRVIAINRVEEDGAFSYEITFKVGRLLRGEQIKVIKFIDGRYVQKEEDNTSPSYAGVGFTMSPMVQINGVYLIYFVKEGLRFRPRSYHYSVSTVQSFVSENKDGDTETIGLVERVGLNEFKNWTRLEDYLKAKQLTK